MPAADPGSVSPDWGFVVKPKWILSHLFALSLIGIFVFAGMWQLNRLSERRSTNALIVSRAFVDPITVGEAFGRPESELDYLAITTRGSFIDSEVVRVANRSRDGRGGDWVVATFQTESGDTLLVNRGFVLRQETTAPAPEGVVELSGWLRKTRTKGVLGSDDSGEGLRVPRLNVDDVAARVGSDVLPAWLLLEEVDGESPGAADQSRQAVIPRPIALGDLTEGKHLGYAVQWFSFALMSVVVYLVVLVRLAGAPPRSQPEM